jgi:hypothetical protein
MPAVSIIVTVYNGQRYLAEALDSLWAQTYTDFELIVIDDGSTDATPQILDGYRDPRLVRRTHPENQGIPSSANEGLALAGGALVARQDADDISMPERLAVQVAHMQAHPELGLLGTAFWQIDAAGVTQRQVFPEPAPDRLRWKLLFANPICHSSTMYRRDLVERVGGYSMTNPQASDYGLWVRMAAAGPVANLPQPLVRYRMHAENVTSRRGSVTNTLARRISREAVTELLGYEPPPALQLLQRLPVLWEPTIREALLAKGIPAQQAGIRQLADDLVDRFCAQRLHAGTPPAAFRRWARAYLARNLRDQASSLLKATREMPDLVERRQLMDVAALAFRESIRFCPNLLAQPRTWRIGRPLMLRGAVPSARVTS